MIANLFLFVLLSASSAFAFDCSSYDLTEKQKAYLEKMSAQGKADSELVALARAFEKSNHPVEVYIPPYKKGDIEAVTRWAIGSAYYSFAKVAGFEFDRKAYMADCPNLPLFGFGLYTGSTYLRADVMAQNLNVAWHLSYLLNKDKDRFREEYLHLIQATEFLKHLSPHR